jgi:hypothetical protein
MEIMFHSDNTIMKIFMIINDKHNTNCSDKEKSIKARKLEINPIV